MIQIVHEVDIYPIKLNSRRTETTLVVLLRMALATHGPRRQDLGLR